MRSVNQNHHLYVVTGSTGVVTGNNKVTDASKPGAIKAVVSGEGVDKDLYFMYRGRDGVTRSDLIPVNQITYMKMIPAAAQTTKLKTVTVSLDSNVSSTPIAGQDYVLNISFQQFYGLSPEDTYVKTVAVRATSAMSTAALLFTEMVKELKASFSREVGADAQNNPYLDFEVSGSNLVITEKKQAWSLGKWEAESLMFEVFPSTIYSGGMEVTWGTTTNGVSETEIPNSKKMADLEWFTFAERADFYRGMGYPNNFDYKGLVDPDNENGYAALEIHFAYQGSCEDIQKSEKDITIIGSDSDISNLVDVLKGSNYLNTTIPVVSVESKEDEGDNNS